ncbi:oxidoreductase [Desulfosarcina widdelii]|uniref:Oxidoreductase n=1 Tax=Desulfosarcina widdelii TaxID=947919 RepID=A0A5K7Z5M8_9BACT|nr:FAD-dependent oxidoreductase [Desulfosarcina widdelii]BBO75213.1 oxidoreductase [Desulfosarcina widdelii]
MTKQRIAVVGAGIAGLTAAYFLKQMGKNPVVLEKSDRVGGRMGTDIVNGFTIDYGAQFLMDKFTLQPELIERLGLKRKFIRTSQHIGIVREGKIRIFCAAHALTALKTGLLSLSGCLRFVYRGCRLLARTKSIPLTQFSAWSDYDDIDADTWSNRYFGEEITDYVIEPPNDVFYYYQSLRDTSRVVPMFTTSLLFLKRAKYMTLTGGINVLPQRMASELDVRLNTPVQSMSIDKTGIELSTDNERIFADRVILATTGSVSRNLYKEPSAIERELLNTPYSSAIVVALAVKDSFGVAPEIAELYGVLIPKKERSVVNAIANGDLGKKDKSRVANGKLFMAFLSGKAGSEMIDWNDKDILSVVLKDMEEYLCGISTNLLFTKIYRWKEAAAMSPLGRSKNVARYRKNVNESTQVFLAGDYMGLPCTEGAAESGKWAAEAIFQLSDGSSGKNANF